MNGGEAPGARAAVIADRFDLMAWHEIRAEAPELDGLARSLNRRHDHTDDLLADVFLLAYKVAPQMRERAAMHPARRVNHQVVASLADSREFAALHRETSGDPYAAALAVLAQGEALRRMLERAAEATERARRAERAGRARQEAGGTAAAGAFG
ncbi:hypothetical protein DY218_17190, partial [Streptomyces triticagri]